MVTGSPGQPTRAVASKARTSSAGLITWATEIETRANRGLCNLDARVGLVRSSFRRLRGRKEAGSAGRKKPASFAVTVSGHVSRVIETEHNIDHMAEIRATLLNVNWKAWSAGLPINVFSGTGGCPVTGVVRIAGPPPLDRLEIDSGA